MELRLSPEDRAKLLSDYAEPWRSQFEAHLPDVATALRSPEGTTWVLVSWFWDSPQVRMLSLTEAGSLVQTEREWENVPPWPRQLARGHRHLVVREEMMRASVPDKGRSIAVVPGADACRMVEAHEAHVAAYEDLYGSPRVPVGGLPELMRVSDHAMGHAVRAARRVRWFGGEGPWLLVLAWFVALWTVVRVEGSTALAVTAALVALALAAGPWWHVRVGYLRWLRPRYRPLA
jgi:hypothetical protein